jgi:hypothetical protein
MRRTARPERQQCPDRDPRVRCEQNHVHVRRKLQTLHGSAITAQDAERTQENADVPEDPGDDQGHRTAELSLRETRHQPDDDREGRIEAPPVDQNGGLGGADAAIGQPLALGQKRRGMQLECGDDRQRGAHHKPDRGSGGKIQPGKADGCVNRRTLHARRTGLRGRGGHSKRKA